LCKIFPIISELLEEDKIDYEILVVNDNSQDKTEAVLQKIDQGNPRIRYINNYYPNSFGLAVRGASHLCNEHKYLVEK
jgi:dolichol-phosphate mannosyltransferase